MKGVRCKVGVGVTKDRKREWVEGRGCCVQRQEQEQEQEQKREERKTEMVVV